eukprot:jgi/Undpi1/3269/HiC_scaffold_15.g06643.m1
MSRILLLGVAVAAAFNCFCLHGVSGFLSTPSIPTLWSVKSKTSCFNRRSIDGKESEGAAEKVDGIIGELETLQQGFKEGEVDGEWVLCFTRNSKGSPSLQKALPGDRGFQNFDVGAKKFFNIAKLWGGKVQVLADVAYDVEPEEPNRLVASIVGAGVKLGPLRIPLPLTGRVGYLDFVYQDSDIRITRGNRGGLFLHMRPGSSFPVDAETKRVA